MRFLDYMSTRPGRLIRAAVGLALIAAGAAFGGGWWALAAFGLLPLATGVFGICPISPFFCRSLRGNACRTGSASRPSTGGRFDGTGTVRVDRMTKS